MKICTIVGARPQFIKAAALSRILRKEHDEILIHTGQHYDHNMSKIFFDELNIPKPDYNLDISGGTHGDMTGRMLMRIEEVLIKEKPQMVLVYGDTNSTLAGALAAVKLHIPVCHVEAGVRMGTLINPEEVNRLLVDRISSLLLCCTETGEENLAREGIVKNVHNTGDLMYDAVIYYCSSLTKPSRDDITTLDGSAVNIPEEYFYLTCHREENTNTDAPLTEILSALNSLETPTIYPVHPRNRQRVVNLRERYDFNNIMLVNPVGYKTSLYLLSNADKVLTDSGGLQREAWFMGKQCITFLDNSLWPETFDGNINQMCAAEKSEILAKLSVKPDFSKKSDAFGNGNAAEKITRIIGDSCNSLT